MRLQCLFLRRLTTMLSLATLLGVNALAAPVCRDFYLGNSNQRNSSYLEYSPQQQHPNFAGHFNLAELRQRQAIEMGRDLSEWGLAAVPTANGISSSRVLDYLPTEIARVREIDAAVAALVTGAEVRYSISRSDVVSHLGVLLENRGSAWARSGAVLSIERSSSNNSNENVLVIRKPNLGTTDSVTSDFLNEIRSDRSIEESDKALRDRGGQQQQPRFHFVPPQGR